MASNRSSQLLLLTLAVIPTVIVVVMAAYLWLHGETTNFNWQSKIWPVVAIQLVAITAFGFHAGSNKRLAPGEAGEWIFQFIVFIPFGMIRYWTEHVWGRDPRSRPE